MSGAVCAWVAEMLWCHRLVGVLACVRQKQQLVLLLLLLLLVVEVLLLMLWWLVIVVVFLLIVMGRHCLRLVLAAVTAGTWLLVMEISTAWHPEWVHQRSMRAVTCHQLTVLADAETIADAAAAGLARVVVAAAPDAADIVAAAAPAAAASAVPAVVMMGMLAQQQAAGACVACPQGASAAVP